MTGVLIRRGEDTQRYTQGRRPRDEVGRGWSDAATKSRSTKVCQQPPEARKKNERMLLYRLQKGA